MGGEVAGHYDLEHFDVVAMADLAMANARRLMHAGTGIQADTALAFIFELDPALEDVHQLEAGCMRMRLA
jgi:hypothetical protein